MMKITFSMEIIEQNGTENDELWNAKQMKYIKSYIKY